MANLSDKRRAKKGGVKRIADAPEFKELKKALEYGGVNPARLNDYIEAELDAEVLTIKQVADLIQVSRQTVYALINRGELVGKRVGKRWRFSRKQIIEWIEGKQNE